MSPWGLHMQVEKSCAPTEGALFISDVEAAALFGASRAWFQAKVRAGVAPRPVIQGARFTRWRRSDVLAFAERIAKNVAQETISAVPSPPKRGRPTKASVAWARHRDAAATEGPQ